MNDIPLNWNEIKNRALGFSNRWKDVRSEKSEAQAFLMDFLGVFNVERRRFASFEYKVTTRDGGIGYIDLLWKGMILIEMKSQGKDLIVAHKQAVEYLDGLKNSELPKYILVSDFQNFRLYDLDSVGKPPVCFELKDLEANVHHFGEIAGYKKKEYKDENPANIKAAELMGKLHDQLKENGYTEHKLEVYLVRMLFCLFADDTNIFKKQEFQDYIEQRTTDDGSDTGSKLTELFQVLNTPIGDRFTNLDEQLMKFPYINGKLFEENLPMPSFDKKMKEVLLECCAMDWSEISPAIFGSMFQSVMDKENRRTMGAHYTSEQNILKVIKPLFLDELYDEFDRANTKPKLEEFHEKLKSLRLFDPACGCGNFLVVAYRELRLLELKILRKLDPTGQTVIDIKFIVKIDVDQFYGIECEEFPARIAETAMWLVDHQMNCLVSREFGQTFDRLPLKKAAHITVGDALKIDWETIVPKIRWETIDTKSDDTKSDVTKPDGTKTIVPKTNLIYILGNPPFVGYSFMNKSQKEALIQTFENAFQDTKHVGYLDYVTGWYSKAAQFVQGTRIKTAFVSTNSIVQGMQVSILFKKLLAQGIFIHFAHRTFKWNNEARGKAAVHCVIIGFAQFEPTKKRIFEYDDIKGDPREIKANNINPYLVDAKNLVIEQRHHPLCAVPEMYLGNIPRDGGHLLLSDEEKVAFLEREPAAAKFIKPLISGHHFLHGKNRWCLWLVDASPHEKGQMPAVMERIEAVEKFRKASCREGTQKLADFSTLFDGTKNPEQFILIPRVSSEHRKYIPMAFFKNGEIAGDTCQTIPDGTLYHFGVLTSAMHMAWVNAVCGRLESRFNYSKDVVYNNYPWPVAGAGREKHSASIEKCAQAVLDARAAAVAADPKNTLADLYNPITMPPDLTKAHATLDRAVDVAYRPQPFPDAASRLAFLFDLYETYTAGIFPQEKSKPRRKR